jgi:uncharacterized protein
MGRLLVLVAFVLIGVWLVRRALARAEASDAPGASPRAARPDPRASEELVGCAQCGLLVPRAEARSTSGLPYCSDEHARLGPRRR